MDAVVSPSYIGVISSMRHSRRLESRAASFARASFIATLLALALVTSVIPAMAEQSEDGLAAYQRADYATALRLWRPLADQGDAFAEFRLGAMYYDGQGVTQDQAEAAKWFRQAADQGYAAAQVKLGLMYENGQGVARDFAEAAKWYSLAADFGLADAQARLGLLYAAGGGIPRDDAKAAKLFLLSAAQGNAEGEFGLGMMYSFANNYAESAKWLRKSAEQGYVLSEVSLARDYESGRGVPQDDAEAMRWHRKAADHGNTDSQIILGQAYSNGRILPRDLVEAYKWLSLAIPADASSKPASYEYPAAMRDVIAAFMSPAEIAEAQKRAREWKPQ